MKQCGDFSDKITSIIALWHTPTKKTLATKKVPDIFVRHFSLTEFYLLNAANSSS